MDLLNMENLKGRTVVELCYEEGIEICVGRRKP